MNLWKAYLDPTPKNVKKWLLAIESIIATCAGSAYITQHEQAAFWILISGAVINKLGNLLTDENK